MKFSTVILHPKGPGPLRAQRHYNCITGMAKNSLFRGSQTVHTIRTKFSTVFLHHIRVLYVQWHQNRLAGM